jgi:hypothetical protein
MSDQVRKRIQLTLRTGQLTYLEYLAERSRITVHHALDLLLLERRKIDSLEAGIPPRKERIDVWLSTEALSFLDQAAVRFGLERSDIARRLIDETQSRDTTI